MTKKSSRKKPSRALHRLVPDRFTYLFEKKPLLPFEDERSYDRLLADNMQEFSPATLIEHIVVKDIVDTQWELMRLRSVKTSAIQVEMPHAAVNYLHEDWEALSVEEGSTGRKSALRSMIRAATMSCPYGTEETEEMLESMNITHDGLVYMATATAADKLNMIDARIAKLGRRRDELIDKYETRRRMLAAMQNSLVEKRPHADVIDVTPARDLHGVPSTD